MHFSLLANCTKLTWQTSGCQHRMCACVQGSDQALQQKHISYLHEKKLESPIRKLTPKFPRNLSRIFGRPLEKFLFSRSEWEAAQFWTISSMSPIEQKTIFQSVISFGWHIEFGKVPGKLLTINKFSFVPLHRAFSALCFKMAAGWEKTQVTARSCGNKISKILEAYIT